VAQHFSCFRAISSAGTHVGKSLPDAARTTIDPKIDGDIVWPNVLAAGSREHGQNLDERIIEAMVALPPGQSRCIQAVQRIRWAVGRVHQGIGICRQPVLIGQESHLGQHDLVAGIELLSECNALGSGHWAQIISSGGPQS
jgi:hypothetical protein